MIITEIRDVNGTQFRVTFSTNNKYIRKVGTEEIYDIAFDVVDSIYEYEETDETIENVDSVVGEEEVLE